MKRQFSYHALEGFKFELLQHNEYI